MIDLATIILFIIALIALCLVALSFPSVLREYRKWQRRQRLTPLQRAFEDISESMRNLADAFSSMFAPIVSATAEAINGLAEAMKVDPKVDIDEDSR